MAQTNVADQGPDADSAHTHKKLVALAVGAIGVVCGDIGTSPLYAFREAINATKDAQGIVSPNSVLGVLSLILWSLLLIVTLKYVVVLLRADNNGEGGTFALQALGLSVAKRSGPVIFALGIIGASFFYGDAVIAPAISVLSAVEGLTLVSPELHRFVLPISICILIGLFAVQSHGTATVARFFGPIMAVWFSCLAIGGLIHILDEPLVFAALSPTYGISFLISNGLVGFMVLGLVFLAVTGAEALYVDLGHFGRRPIQFAWFTFVFPALVLNYFGQGALVLSNPKALANPFYSLYPEWALIPMVLLATCATVIAGQAVITGAFSLTRQAIQLGLLPRLEIRHTSESMAGQIYLPRVNWLLLAGVLFVVAIFKSSSNLAAAYGVAVTADMVISSMLMFFVVWKLWRWPLWKTLALILPMLLIEQVFFAANMIKVLEGGWLPLTLAAILAVIMATWVRGAGILSRYTRKNEAELDWLVRKLETKPPHRVPGTAVFFTADLDFAPTSLMHNLKHNRVLHERNIVLSIRTEDTPRVARHARVSVDRTNDTFIKVIARYGFMETPSIPKIIEVLKRKDLKLDIGATSFFLSRRSLRVTSKSEMPRWQEHLFIMLARSAQDATTYFKIPTDRVVEVGTQVAV
ncbi:MAG: potassium transporter Kup [Hyphomicrobiaceae bacterium]|nr:potassium transporter Kup [Hyphomicrobiaceae bacterium]